MKRNETIQQNEYMDERSDMLEHFKLLNREEERREREKKNASDL